MNALGYLGASLSVLAGVMGLVWPRQVSTRIGLATPSLLGVSEVRATYGGLFIGAGAAVLLSGSTTAATVLGAAWGGAFVGRALSVVIDRSRSKENVAGLVLEATMAALLLLAGPPGGRTARAVASGQLPPVYLPGADIAAHTIRDFRPDRDGAPCDSGGSRRPPFAPSGPSDLSERSFTAWVARPAVSRASAALAKENGDQSQPSSTVA